MRAAFDQFAKQLLNATLAPVGHVESEREVAPDAQKIDVWFVPDPARSEERSTMGLLGRMAEEPCLFEAFHEPPDAEAIRACLRKHYAWQSLLGKQPDSPQVSPSLWLLSAGRPRRRMKDFALDPARGWPEGVYTAPTGYGLRLVVIPELPRTPDTLSLRLLGAGRVLVEAAKELVSLPRDSPLLRQAAPIVVRFRIIAVDDPANREREEFMQATADLFEEFQQKMIGQGIEQGRSIGIEQGRQEALQKLFQLRLDRLLTDAESQTLTARTGRLGIERIERVALMTNAAECAAWLADPDAS